jgi:hypothetical protein
MNRTDNVPVRLRRKRTPRWIRRIARFVSGNPVAAAITTRLAVWFMKLTFVTNSWTIEPEDALESIQSLLPVICTVWHGQHIMLPVIPIKGAVMVSRSLDGEITARIAEAFGSSAIRASGGRDKKKLIEKGGIEGFVEMMKVLESGGNVAQTADIPKGVPRVVGYGVITLAKRSGRPIIPVTIASSRRKVFVGAWDRTTLSLPFGRSAVVMGEPIFVAADASDDDLEDARKKLQDELTRVTARAYELTGRPE